MVSARAVYEEPEQRGNGGAAAPARAVAIIEKQSEELDDAYVEELEPADVEDIEEVPPERMEQVNAYAVPGEAVEVPAPEREGEESRQYGRDRSTEAAESGEMPDFVKRNHNDDLCRGGPLRRLGDRRMSIR